jgi:transcriptional regulator with XRE-family HTH domain
MPRLFGDKLRTLRVQRQLTQVELARRLELMGQSHISYLERGLSAPSLDVVVRAADVFGVAIDYLLRDILPVDPPILAPSSASASQPLIQQFGQRLRDMRTRQGLTQTELALRLAPISRAYISMVEAGRKAPSIAFVLLCADLFGVSTDDLIRQAEPTDESPV